MMAVAPFAVIAGPANIWIAPALTAFPAINAAPGAGWTALGRTEGGVMVKHVQNVELLLSDQDIAAIKAIRSEEGLEISTELVELTLENYRKAINDAVITTEVGPPAIKRIDLKQGFEVATFAFLVRGPSAYGNFEAQYQVPMVVQTEEPEMSFVRDDKSTLAVVYTALATLDGSPQFGRLVMQTA